MSSRISCSPVRNGSSNTSPRYINAWYISTRPQLSLKAGDAALMSEVGESGNVTPELVDDSHSRSPSLTHGHIHHSVTHLLLNHCYLILSQSPKRLSSMCYFER